MSLIARAFAFGSGVTCYELCFCLVYFMIQFILFHDMVTKETLASLARVSPNLYK